MHITLLFVLLRCCSLFGSNNNNIINSPFTNAKKEMLKERKVLFCAQSDIQRQQHSKESKILICELFTASRIYNVKFASVWINVKEKDRNETIIFCSEQISERRQQIECAHVAEMEDWKLQEMLSSICKQILKFNRMLNVQCWTFNANAQY